MRDDIYVDWEGNYDVRVFKVEVPDAVVTIIEGEAAAEDRDMHGDFSLCAAMELAADKLKAEALRMRTQLELRYPELY